MVQVIIFVILIASVVVSIFLSREKSVFSRVLMLCFVPVSYALSVLLARIGTWNFISDAIASLIIRKANITDLTEASSSLDTGILEVISFVFVHIFIVVVFVALLFGFRFLVKYLDSKKERNKNRIAVAVLSGVFSFFVCLLSILPLSLTANISEETVNSKYSEQYRSSSVSGTYSVLSEIYSALEPDSPLGFVCTYTGIRPIHDATTSILSGRTVTTNEGEKKDVNCTLFGNLILRDTFDVLVITDKFDKHEMLNMTNVVQAYNVLDSIKKNSTLHDVADELSKHYFVDVLTEKDKYKIVIYLIIQLYLKG